MRLKGYSDDQVNFLKKNNTMSMWERRGAVGKFRTKKLRKVIPNAEKVGPDLTAVWVERLVDTRCGIG